MTDQTEQTPKPGRTPQSGARFYHAIKSETLGKVRTGSPVRTVRCVCYNPRNFGGEAVVSIGIGPENTKLFATAAVKVTEELWNEIDQAMREALRAAR